MSILEELSALLQQGRAPKVKQLVAKALEEGIAPKDILEQGLLAGMGVIGDKFKLNQVFVPEVLIAARAMNAGLEVLKPALQTGDVEDKGTVVIGTVKGDQHDIGKNLVKMMMEGRGLKVIDLGVNEKNALIVQPEDVEGLSKAIVKLAENPKLRSEIARNGLETARMLDWHNATELFEKCMWEALICYDT